MSYLVKYDFIDWDAVDQKLEDKENKEKLKSNLIKAVAYWANQVKRDDD